MERTSTELIFKWFEEVWTSGYRVPHAPLSDGINTPAVAEASALAPAEAVRLIPTDLVNKLADFELGFESFASDGNRVSCAMVVKAHNRTSGEPVAYRALLDGRVRDGRLVRTANASDAL